MNTTILILVRHGESEAYDYLPGRKPGVNLSAAGVAEVKNLAKHLTRFNIDIIFSSPVDRTKQTAEIISSSISKEIKFADELMEIDFGEWTGKSFAELKNDNQWKLFHKFRSGTRIPGGETILEVQFRMIKKIEEIISKYSGKTILIVSHGDPIKSALCYYLGLPLDFISRVSIDTASLSVLILNESGPIIKSLNHKP